MTEYVKGLPSVSEEPGDESVFALQRGFESSLLELDAGSGQIKRTMNLLTGAVAEEERAYYETMDGVMSLGKKLLAYNETYVSFILHDSETNMTDCCFRLGGPIVYENMVKHKKKKLKQKRKQRDFISDASSDINMKMTCKSTDREGYDMIFWVNSECTSINALFLASNCIDAVCVQ